MKSSRSSSSFMIHREYVSFTQIKANCDLNFDKEINPVTLTKIQWQMQHENIDPTIQGRLSKQDGHLISLKYIEVKKRKLWFFYHGYNVEINKMYF